MVEIENELLRVKLAEDGAEVREVFHKKEQLQFMWSGDPDYWGRVSPILFPIVGALKGDRYLVDGRSYSLPQHGFLRDKRFKLVEKSATRAVFRFSSDRSLLDIYPYEFEIMIDYRLKQNELTVGWQVHNRNKGDMYFSIGAHPAFQIPLIEGESLSDYYIMLQPRESEIMEYGVEQGLIYEKGQANDIKMIELTDRLFANDALIYRAINEVTIASKKHSHQIKVMHPGFPFVGIWSKFDAVNQKAAPFICIEPWYGIADRVDANGDYKKKFGINHLPEHGIFETGYSIEFT